jgi:hypothetical protein
MMNYKSLKLTLILSLTFLLAPCLSGCGLIHSSAPTEQYDATVAVSWFDLYLKLVQETEGFTPPVASRTFGYAGVTLYESVVPGMPGHQSLVGQLNELYELPEPESGVVYHWPTAANSALAYVTKRLFVDASNENMDTITALEARLAHEFRASLDPSVFHRSVAYGEAIGISSYEWSLYDRGHEGNRNNFPADYSPPTGADMWIPAAPGASALAPIWGANRPFVLISGQECAPSAPLRYSESNSSSFYAEAQEVYNTVSTLTTEQRAIAEFWADNPGQTATPPGHSVSILNQFLEDQGASLDVAAEAYAKVGIAVADAFIGCWYTKYRYNVLRPNTYIQRVIDPNWQSLINTPPFPEYTSGHSVQAAAVAQVLTDMFGSNVSITDHTHEERGLPARSFDSFFAVAEEAAISRLYGGIHFRTAIEQGLDQGACIGRRVSAIRFEK